MSARADQTFLLADLAGYTALTEVHGDEEAAALIEEYVRSMQALISEHEATLVKTIGDALLIRVPEAGQAVRLGLRATREIGMQHGFPSIRVGMHHGPAVERDGDYFGRTVNIAARVSALAAAGEVLVTDAVVEAAGRVESVRFIDRGRHPLKGVEQPVPVLLASSGAEETAGGLPIDPVCHMAVDPERATGMLVHQGSRFYFCSIHCAQRFAERPERFA